MLGPMLDMVEMLDTVDSPNELLRARGDEDPTLSLRPDSRPPVATALLNKGLETGENGVPEETRRSVKVGVEVRGEEVWRLALTGLALREVDRRYRGGVTYVVPGVTGGAAPGSKPRSAR